MKLILMRKIGLTILMLFFLISYSPLKAETRESAPNTKELIFEHIGDAYGWHITTIGETTIGFNLPVFVYSKEKGWFLFSSGKVHDGEIYDGFYIAKEGKYSGKIVERNSLGAEVRPLDFSLTKNVLGLLIASFIILSVVLICARWYRKHPMEAPGGFVGMIEAVVEFIRNDVIINNVGHDYKRYQNYLLTVFFFILVNNLLGLIPVFPGGANVTGNIAITLTLALFTFFIVNLTATKAYWKGIFWPDVPIFLKLPVPLMPALEIVEIFTKPFSLMIRLFANIMAGHTVALSLTCVIFATVAMGTAINSAMTAVSVLLSVFMFFVEILVSFLQAYIFTILSSVYIGLARAEHH
jgi:F-type H+-transporting ATPase subunit a